MSIDTVAIRERYTLALNAKPSKGPFTEAGISALCDSVCDVPELLKEIERLQATISDANTLWLNGFACISPSDEFAAEVGRNLINTVGVPGRALVRVAIS